MRGRKPDGAKAAAEGTAVALPGERSSALIEPPAELTPEARAYWEKVIPDLAEMGVYVDSDVFLLTEMAENYAMAVRFRRQVTKLQTDLEAADTDDLDRLELLSGQLKRARAGYLQHQKMLWSMAAEFGTTPTSRVRLGISKLQGASLLSMFGVDPDD